MKTLFTNVRLGSFAVLFVVALVTGCKDDEPVPQGNLIVYTNFDEEKYDRIEVIVDDRIIGSLTESIDTRPDCNAPGAAGIVSLMLPVGTHSVAAKRYKGNNLTGKWNANNAEITIEDCKRLRLVD